MKIFVIGGTGFISGRLVDKLLDAGHSVTTFTRRSVPSSQSADGKLTVCHGDRKNADSLREALGRKSFDAVIDMVAYGPADSRTSIEVFGGRTGRFVHCSTVSVYMVSDQVHCPITEDQHDRPLMSHWPRNPFGMDYGIDKRSCEEVLWAAHDEEGFPVTILRPTFVSGPGDPARRDHFWIERILDGAPMLVPGSGDYAFQQVFVDDVVQAFVSVLGQPASVGRAYNVASEDVYSLNDYLLRLADLLGHSPALVHVDQEVFDCLALSISTEGDVFPFNTRRTAVFSLDQIKSDIDYRSTPFEDWMSRTIEWFGARGEHSLGYERRDQEIVVAEKWREVRSRTAAEVGRRFQ